MKHKVIISAIVAIATLTPLFVSATALAQTTEPDTPTTTAEERRTIAQQKREEAATTVCERIQARLQTRSERIVALKDTHTTVYERLLGRLDTIIATAEEKGYDTADLTAARAAVNAEVEEYQTLMTTFAGTLDTTAAASCEDTAKYGTTISTARAELKTVRDAAHDVRTTFREEVIPALKDFRAWLQENREANQ